MSADALPAAEALGTVRVRFCPSPTGNPHVGLVRAALFNWAFARHHGGAFVFRIEDTDAARDTEESYEQLLDSLRWLGLDWDEGPDIGGPVGPYRQSQRRDIYDDVVRRLLEAGEAYESFSSAEEIEARHRAAGHDPKLGYDNADRELTAAQAEAFRARGRGAVVRLRMPAEEVSWTDLVRGPVSFAAGSVPDFVLARANGDPLYPLVNPLDDALMGITHVLRGEDLLPSTPRQIALYAALRRIGIDASTPLFGHLPLVRGEGNRKLSKRAPEASLQLYRERGFLPEGLLNYLALLGWAIADDRDVFSMSEMAAAFDIDRVSSNPARFDLQKAEAINGSHIRLLSVEEFAARVTPYLQSAGLVATPPSDTEAALIDGAAPLVAERVTVLSEAVDMMRFLFTTDLVVDSDAAAKFLGTEAGPVLRAAVDALERLSTWDSASIEAALKAALVDGLGLKPRQAFAPIRVAVSGRTVSPPLYESMDLLGRERSLDRLCAALG
ncbi:MAG: glutamate--tRNA ligase [Geodermatophilaceae bacterium]